MAVTYRRFLRLKLQEEGGSFLLEAGAERVSRQVEEEGGLDASARAMIVQDITAAYVTGGRDKSQSALARMPDAELIDELFRAEASA
ncbi:MAG: hypothetical protein GWN84_09750 [Gammaproteobacteria bacterium]|nr:hypothetical protein [Gammaproteobacteria bacterium]NIR83148.1 hypothetical protein [Gammaproteobacteria bacterium]NIR90956.1 hypothetical protein [Gammaproteobacteria bacterium]NIU04313.1 hypothetical protein [Gammaproteobacteria bacterium]NIV52536.1 hypothetical protein [Gammaproteobacteria bacterium]